MVAFSFLCELCVWLSGVFWFCDFEGSKWLWVGLIVELCFMEGLGVIREVFLKSARRNGVLNKVA